MPVMAAYRVLLVHNHYQQRGGEDQVVAAEARLLRERGHEVIQYSVHNDSIKELSRARLAWSTVWNHRAYAELRSLTRERRPHVYHVHNTLPLISPAVYYAAKAEGVAVVQTLHNYRLYCPNGLFLRNGNVCEDCLGKLALFPSVFHGCYRGSRSASAAVATMLTVHRRLGTWVRKVDVYIALSRFAKSKFMQCGLPGDRLKVKPNFVHSDIEIGDGSGGYILYTGRLSPEKGLRTLMSALNEIDGAIQCIIVGDGPVAENLRGEASRIGGVTLLGYKPPSEVYDLIGRALCIVMPSEWYENFPRVIVESYAAGTPVIAARIGALAELVDHGHTGLHFRAGDATDLARQIRWAASHPQQMAAMRKETRAKYEANYTADRNYGMLMEIYGTAISTNAKSHGSPH